MTPYLNEDYDQMQTKSDIVLVNMWGGGGLWPWERKRRLERGMVVTFRFVYPCPWWVSVVVVFVLTNGTCVVDPLRTPATWPSSALSDCPEIRSPQESPV